MPPRYFCDLNLGGRDSAAQRRLLSDDAQPRGYRVQGKLLAAGSLGANRKLAICNLVISDWMSPKWTALALCGHLRAFRTDGLPLISSC